jgi:hypothetical protein
MLNQSAEEFQTVLSSSSNGMLLNASKILPLKLKFINEELKFRTQQQLSYENHLEDRKRLTKSLEECINSCSKLGEVTEAVEVIVPETTKEEEEKETKEFTSWPNFILDIFENSGLKSLNSVEVKEVFEKEYPEEFKSLGYKKVLSRISTAFSNLSSKGILRGSYKKGSKRKNGKTWTLNSKYNG